MITATGAIRRQNNSKSNGGIQTAAIKAKGNQTSRRKTEINKTAVGIVT